MYGKIGVTRIKSLASIESYIMDYL